eukprot:7314390-Pyramimonas_sp.AAC.1
MTVVCARICFNLFLTADPRRREHNLGLPPVDSHAASLDLARQYFQGDGCIVALPGFSEREQII